MEFLPPQDPRVRRFPLKYSEAIDKVSNIIGIEKYLVLSIMKAESAFRPGVISPVGARGLMQMMPATANKLSKTLEIEGVTPKDLSKPEIAIAYGAYYLDYLLKIFNGNYLATHCGVQRRTTESKSVVKYLQRLQTR